jgi:cyanate permease
MRTGLRVIHSENPEDLDLGVTTMNSSRSEIMSTWLVAFALVMAIAIRSLLPELPPRLAAVRAATAVSSSEAAALASVPDTAFAYRVRCPG